MATEGKTWRNYGCLGFLGLLGLAAMIAVGLLTVAWFQVRGEETVASVLEQAVPASSAETAPQSTRGTLPAAPLARVLLDIKDADVTISAGPAGAPLRVDASYDARYFALEQKPSPDGADPPTWHVWFRRVGGSGPIMHVLHQFVGATRPEINVRLPRDLPLALHINSSSGLTVADLGGLRIREVYAEVSTGGLEIDLSEPSMPMDRFEIHSRQSTIAVRQLGNASPRQVKIDILMGSATLDLRGAWRLDAELLLKTKMVRGSLRLPDGVNIEGIEGRWALEAGETPGPTLRFKLESEMGDLEVEP